MTETEMSYTTITHCCGTVPNIVLNNFCYQAALKVPELTYTDDEYAFARTLYTNATGAAEPLPDDTLLPTALHAPLEEEYWPGGSTDVGDVSHIVPTLQVSGPGEIGGVPAHHWGITAATGMSIGEKGASYASKILAQCAYEAFTQPSVIEEFKAEFDRYIAEKNPSLSQIPSARITFSYQTPTDHT